MKLGGSKDLQFWNIICKFLFRIWILLARPRLLLVHRSVVFKIFLFFLNLCIFNDKKSLDVIILLIIWFLMITWPALCPARSTPWNKTPESQLPINRISSSFFAPYLLASLKAIECSTGLSNPSGRTNISTLNFANGRTSRMAGPASSTLVKLSLKYFLLSHFLLVFLPTTLASLSLGVMLINCTTTPRDSATNIEKNIPKRRARVSAT